MVKKILIGLGVLVVLAVAAVVIVPNLIDWNSYKSTATDTVREATGRDLAVDGDISFSMLWSPSLSINKVRFANIDGGSSADMAAAEAIEVRVALAPLLQGRIEVERIAVVRPTILLERLADGRANWELALPQTPDSEDEASETTGPDIRFDDITVLDGTLIYRDAMSGDEHRIDDLDTSLSAVTLEGPYRASGTLAYRSVSLGFSADVGNLGAAGPTPLMLALEAAGAEAKLEFTGSADVAAESPAISGRLTLIAANLAALLDRAAPGGATEVPVQLDQPMRFGGDLSFAREGGAIQNLELSLGDTTATGSVRMTAGTPSKVEAGLLANRLDLDRLLTAEPRSADQVAEPAGSAPLDEFVLPTGLDASLDLGVAALSYRGGVISDVRLQAVMSNGEINLQTASALLPGGASFAASGVLAAAEGAPRFVGRMDGKADNLRGLLEWLQVVPPQVPSDRLRTFMLASRIAASPASFELSELDLKLDNSRISGGIAVALPGVQRPKPAFGIGLAVDQINLDAYLPPVAKEGSDGGDGSEGLPLSRLAPLAGVDANVELRVGKLTVNGETLQGLHMDGTLQGGGLTLRDLSVKEFAGGKGALSGTLADLAGTPRFNTTFDLSAADAGKALLLAGLARPTSGKLGALKLNGSLAGGTDNITYDLAFSLAGIGATGKATGRAVGFAHGIPRVDSDFDLKAKNAAPLLEILGLPAADGKGLGAVSVAGKATSGEDDVTYDLAVTLAGVGGQARLDGKIRRLSGTPQIDTRLDVSAKKPAPLLALFGLAGPSAGKLGDLGVAGTMAGGADDMTLDLTLKGLGGTVSLAGKVMAEPAPLRFDIAVAANHPELRQLLSAVVAGYRPVADKLGPLALTGKIAGSSEAASLSGLTLDAGRTQLQGDLRAETAGTKPYLTANLRGGFVDLTPFMPPDSGGTKPAGGERWSREPLDLSALEAMDADVEFAADSFVLPDTRIDDLRAKLTLRDGTLTITQLAGRTYGGAIDLNGRLVGRGVPTFDGRLTASNVSVRELMGGGLLASRVSGPVSFESDLRASGYSMAEMMNGLNGTGQVNGTITVLSQVEQALGSVLLGALGQQVEQMTGFAGARGFTDSINAIYTAFAGSPNTLAGNFRIDGGVLDTRDLTLANDRARATARGTADIAAWTMDMLADIFSQQYPDSPFLSVNLGGPLDGPSPRFTRGALDTGAAATGAAALDPMQLFGTALPGVPGLTGAPGQLPEEPLSVVPPLEGVLEEPLGLPGVPEIQAPSEAPPATPAAQPSEPEPPALLTEPSEVVPGEAAITPEQPVETPADKKRKKKKGAVEEAQPEAQPAPPAVEAAAPPPEQEAVPAIPAETPPAAVEEVPEAVVPAEEPATAPSGKNKKKKRQQQPEIVETTPAEEPAPDETAIAPQPEEPAATLVPEQPAALPDPVSPEPEPAPLQEEPQLVGPEAAPPPAPDEPLPTEEIPAPAEDGAVQPAPETLVPELAPLEVQQ